MYGRSSVKQQWKSTLETLRGWPKTKNTTVKNHKWIFMEDWYWKINDICNGSGSLARTTRRLKKSSKLVTVTWLSSLFCGYWSMPLSAFCFVLTSFYSFFKCFLLCSFYSIYYFLFYLFNRSIPSFLHFWYPC